MIITRKLAYSISRGGYVNGMLELAARDDGWVLYAVIIRCLNN